MASGIKAETGDRRVQRTRRALRLAFVSLLAERGWDWVTVQAVCERADVGRSTFYMHFQGKEDLLEGGLDDLRHELRRQATDERESEATLLPFARGLIEHVREQRRLFRAIVGRRSGHVVQMRFRAMVRELVAEDLARHAAPSWHRDAAAHYVAGALVELLAWWMEGRRAATADEIEHLMRGLARPIVAELRRIGRGCDSIGSGRETPS
jgi:AcrR family transcriptional regulator